MKALDVAQDTAGCAHDLFALGYRAIGVYLRPDRCSRKMIDGLHSVGIQVISIWEKGKPLSAKYFTPKQGVDDARKACEFAEAMGMPAGKEIFAAVDYDASWVKDGAAIIGYFKSFHETCRAAGYLASVYGSGTVCQRLTDLGYAHSGWLSQSRGWAGYKAFKPKASIVQGPVATVLHFDVDLDEVKDPGVCW